MRICSIFRQKNITVQRVCKKGGNSVKKISPPLTRGTKEQLIINNDCCEALIAPFIYYRQRS